MISGDRGIAFDGDGGRRAIGVRNRLHRLAKLGMQFLANAGIEGAYGAQHFHFVRNNVAADAPVDTADRDHGRTFGDIEMAAGNALDGGGNLRCNINGINAKPRR